MSDEKPVLSKLTPNVGKCWDVRVVEKYTAEDIEDADMGLPEERFAVVFSVESQHFTVVDGVDQERGEWFKRQFLHAVMNIMLNGVPRFGVDRCLAFEGDGTPEGGAQCALKAGHEVEGKGHSAG